MLNNMQQQFLLAVEAEKSRIDAIEALDPRKRCYEYWLTLHPVVRGVTLHYAGWEHEKECVIEPGCARQLFHEWKHSLGVYHAGGMTGEEKRLKQAYDGEKEEIWQQYCEAKTTFEKIAADAENAKRKAWAEYREHMQTLPEPVQKRVSYEIARRGYTWSQNSLYPKWWPFAHVGWASYMDPDQKWQDGYSEGVAIGIEAGCFDSERPTLYYQDDDEWPRGWGEHSEEMVEKLLGFIRQYSSGIANVRVEERPAMGWDKRNGIRTRRMVVFELDPDAVKKTVWLSREHVPTEKTGRFVFVLPRAGEFYCTMGEIRHGEAVTLVRDDFCMK